MNFNRSYQTRVIIQIVKLEQTIHSINMCEQHECKCKIILLKLIVFLYIISELYISRVQLHQSRRTYRPHPFATRSHPCIHPTTSQTYLVQLLPPRRYHPFSISVWIYMITLMELSQSQQKQLVPIGYTLNPIFTHWKWNDQALLIYFKFTFLNITFKPYRYFCSHKPRSMVQTQQHLCQALSIIHHALLDKLSQMSRGTQYVSDFLLKIKCLANKMSTLGAPTHRLGSPHLLHQGFWSNLQEIDSCFWNSWVRTVTPYIPSTHIELYLA